MKRIIIVCLFFFTGCACVPPAPEAVQSFAASSDGVPISYTVFGAGNAATAPALVFVHGWSCDSRYWREQVPYFSKKYCVVTLDLAGHGHSGQGRTDYTVALFGDDIAAVVKDLDLKRVILIGHSMSGEICAAAAVRMPERVIGIIGVDTLQNVEEPCSDEQYAALVGPLEKDFVAGADRFVRSMVVSDADPVLIDWIVHDISSAPQQIALSTITNYLGMFKRGEMAPLFEQVTVPVRAVNADKWPTNIEANRRHMRSFDVAILPGADHFLMLERPEEFNVLLADAVRAIEKGQ